QKSRSHRPDPRPPATIPANLFAWKGLAMLEPKASRPHWPDALQNPPKDLSGLKPWHWAFERLEKSHNYWIATTRPDGRPHLMVLWGIWWRGAFWFSTGPRTRKARNSAAGPTLSSAPKRRTKPSSSKALPKKSKTAPFGSNS